MALTDQPYLPFYVDDWMNNNKLKECSPGAHGLMMSIMCLMHKSDTYGTLTLKAKYKQTESKFKNLASYLKKMTCFEEDDIELLLEELVEFKVLIINGDDLICKRMVKDAALSTLRAEVGSKGGKNGRYTNQKKLYNFPGFLYIMEDKGERDLFKIGISKDPEKRLLQLRKLTNKPFLKICKTYNVDDMGTSEDTLLENLKLNRDGEWISGLTLGELIKITDLLLSKNQANTVNGIVNVNEDISLEREGMGEREPENDTIYSKDPVVPEMMKIVKRHDPEYQIGESDFRSARMIGVKINSAMGWLPNSYEKSKKKECLEYFELLISWKMANPFFCTKQLSNIYSQWQNFHASYKQSLKPKINGHGKHTGISTTAGQTIEFD